MTEHRFTSFPDFPDRKRCVRTARSEPRASVVLGLAILALLFGCATPRASRVAIEIPPENTDVLGTRRIVRASAEDTFADVARRHDIGYLELVAANPGVDPWVPGTGREIVLPTDHVLPDAPAEGIVINVAEQRLYWFRGEGDIVTHPIGTGRVGYSTPRGATKIVRKKEHPTWTPGASAHRDDPTLPAVVKAGPENPLGDHALYLGWPSYLVHGTNEPDGVGRRVSRGCIRLYPEDILSLFEQVPIGTPVRVIEEPVKLGWHGDDLVLEAHYNLEQAGQMEDTGTFEPAGDREVEKRIRKLASMSRPPVEVDWTRVARVLEERRGVPIRISGSLEPLAISRPPTSGRGSRAVTQASKAASEAADAVSDAITRAVWTLGRWLDLNEVDPGAAAER